MQAVENLTLDEQMRDGCFAQRIAENNARDARDVAANKDLGRQVTASLNTWARRMDTAVSHRRGQLAAQRPTIEGQHGRTPRSTRRRAPNRASPGDDSEPPPRPLGRYSFPGAPS